MAKLVDLTLLRFSRLVVIERAPSKTSKPFWRCKCDCGREIIASSAHLKDGSTSSCGCYRKTRAENLNKKHGLSYHPLYSILSSIKSRCSDTTDTGFHNYGGRGIGYSPRWESLDNFIEDMYDSYKPGLQIDRIDNNGNYCKENCRWVEGKVNQNNKRNNRFIEYQGQVKTTSQWSDLLNIPYKVLYGRLKRANFSLEKVISKFNLHFETV